MQGKVEICGVNTAKLPVLRGEETKKLLERAQKVLRNQAAESASNADFAGSRAETDYLGLSSTLLNGASRVGRNFYTIGSRGPLLP